MSVVAGPHAPAALSIAEARAYLRIEGEAEDATIAALIRAAESLCEGFTGRVPIERAMTETIPACAQWRRLSATPVRSIASVAALGIDGTATPLPVDGYAIDIDADGDGWVRLTGARDERRLAVGLIAGMAADWNGLPEGLRHGLLRMIAHLFTHRDSAGDTGPPAAVAALWRPWRRMRLS